VTGTTGAYVVTTVNGGIKMTDVAGAGEVSTVNGTVVATYQQNPSAETRFRTVNGKLDLYFQPSLSADFHVKTVNGKAYTDFDMASIGGEKTKGEKVIHRRGKSGTLGGGNGGAKNRAETGKGASLNDSREEGGPEGADALCWSWW